MKSKILLLAVVGLACCCMAACSTSNTSTTPTPDWTHQSFSVRTDSGAGTFVAELKVEEQATGATVTVTAKDAVDLSAAYVTVLYNAEKYAPRSVEIGDFMGRDGELVSLALTNRWQEVPVGIAQIPSTGVGPRNGTGVLAVLHFSAGAFRGTKTVSAKSPQGAKNAVTDLTITASTSTTADLRWTERNTGDYDNNGVVNLSDLTPIGILFKQKAATAPDPVWLALVDGDSNGEINMADITPIGQNFRTTMSGYVLYTDGATGTTPYGTGLTVARPGTNPTPHAPMVYTFQATFVSGSGPKFSVRPAAADDISNPGPVSNVAEIVDVPGAPEPPTGLTAIANEDVGDHKIRLNWTLSSSADVDGYNVERKKTTETDFVFVTKLSASAATYTDTVTDEVSYDYRVNAVDFTALLSTWAGPVSQTPWIFVVSPPKNVAANSVPNSLTIRITWEAPDDYSALGYKLWRRIPASEPAFSVLENNLPAGAGPFSYDDDNLLPDTTYEYYLTSINEDKESVATATVSATTPNAPPLSIVSITTNKTTHLQNGSEGNANITLVTNPASPSSVTWSGPGVFSSTTVQNPTWHPDTNTPLGKVTLTVTASAGGPSANGTIDMYITDTAIITTRGNSGHFVEYPTIPPFMDSIANGGGTVNNKPKSSFFTAGTGKVVLFNLFGLW